LLWIGRPRVEWSLQAELDFLKARSITDDISREIVKRALTQQEDEVGLQLSIAFTSSVIKFTQTANVPSYNDQFADNLIGYYVTRRAVKEVNGIPNADIIPAYNPPLPIDEKTIRPTSVMGAVFSALPQPDDASSWQDILEFKAEERDKLWEFRRFLQRLATKQQAEAEIRDDVEWSLNEYTRAMKIHNLKTRNTSVEMCFVSPIEVLEDIVKFNWSKIARGMVSVKKRQIESMEAEMKAPGRECAYVFDSRKKFGGRQT
jgi:hypothetical protein